MSQTPASQGGLGEPNRQETMSALFANLVIQQTNMALMLLGRVPHPETGERVQDLESARLFIDQLEMLELKTKGNLDKHEDQLLRQSLTTLRMAFVEAVEAGPPPNASPPAPAAKSSDAPASSQAEATSESAPDQEPNAESRKKFSKKY